MKTPLSVAGALTLVLTLHASGQTPDPAVLAPIDAMFHGMTDRDPAAIRSATLPGTILVLMRDGKPEQMTIEDFADRFSKPTKAPLEERIHDPLVRTDHVLGVVRAPLEFLVD